MQSLAHGNGNGCKNTKKDGVAAFRAVLANKLKEMVLAHMVMVTQGQCKKGSRHGVMAEAGKQDMARQMRNR